MNIGHAVFNVSMELKLVAVFRDLDGTYLSGPLIDILEQMPVDGTKVRKVEIPVRNTFGYALDDELTLEKIKLVRVPDIQFILEDGEGRRVAVFRIAHSAAGIIAAAFARSRM